MLVETEKIIERYFSNVFKKFKEWKRLYPYAYTSYDSCPWHFFCSYCLKHKVEPPPHVMIVGKRCHAMKEIYYKRIKIETLSRMLEENATEEIIAGYILRYFLKAIHDDDERSVMTGFSRMEARRLLAIKETHGFDVKALKKYYLPVFTEIKLNAGNFGGKLDTIFRCDDDGFHMPLDWKDGASCPKKSKGGYILYDSVMTQLHIYGILIDDLAIPDELTGDIIASKQYAVAYPRHELVVIKDFEKFIKDTIRENVVGLLENINDKYFPMQIGEHTCGFGAGAYLKCECFDPICKKIFVKLLGFTIGMDGSVMAGIEA